MCYFTLTMNNTLTPLIIIFNMNLNIYKLTFKTKSCIHSLVTHNNSEVLHN